ncbi:unnamed protein product, partial [Phaeothamnion confervicola]
DALVIGGGTAGLSAGFHLKQAGVRYAVLDGNEGAGGAWRNRWKSLSLFSTKRWSSLPGMPMHNTNEKDADSYPTTQEMVWYLREYEERFGLNVMRPAIVRGVTRAAADVLSVHLADGQTLNCRAIISATGTHGAPFVPKVPGAAAFAGAQMHSSEYRGPEATRGRRVVVVGEGNSGAQILAEVAPTAAATLWVTAKEPRILDEEMTGKKIFDTVAALRRDNGGVVRVEDIPSLHSIICVPPVAAAQRDGVYANARRPFQVKLTFTERGVAWTAADGTHVADEFEADVVIWATGYGSCTAHLAPLGIVNPDSTVAVDKHLQAAGCPGVYMLGYGNWAGVGSGSVPGAAMFAKQVAGRVVEEAKSRAAAASAAAAALAPVTPAP